VFQAAFCLSRVVMMAASSAMVHFALSLHIFLGGMVVLSLLGFGIWAFSILLEMGSWS